MPSLQESILDVFINVSKGAIKPEQGMNDVLDMLHLSTKTILCSGDELNEYGESHRKDAEIIKRVLIKNGYVNAGLNDAIGLWCEFSELMAAGWCGLPTNEDDIFECIEPYIKTIHYRLD